MIKETCTGDFYQVKTIDGFRYFIPKGYFIHDNSDNTNYYIRYTSTTTLLDFVFTKNKQEWLLKKSKIELLTEREYNQLKKLAKMQHHKIIPLDKLTENTPDGYYRTPSPNPLSSRIWNSAIAAF